MNWKVGFRNTLMANGLLKLLLLQVSFVSFFIMSTLAQSSEEVIVKTSTGNSQVYTIKLEGGNVQGDKVIRLVQGEVAQLRWISDTRLSIHLHGYDIEKLIQPGTATLMQLKAHATGRFPITMHQLIQHDSHDGKAEATAHSHQGAEKTLIYLEVYPP